MPECRCRLPGSAFTSLKYIAVSQLSLEATRLLCPLISNGAPTQRPLAPVLPRADHEITTINRAAAHISTTESAAYR